MKVDFTKTAANDSALSHRCLELLNELPNHVGVRCDMLVDELYFNREKFTVVATAEKACEEVGAFNCIKLVQKFETDTTGITFTPVSPIPISSVIINLMGEALLEQSQTYKDNFDSKLTKKALNQISKELIAYLNNQREDLSNVIFDAFKI